MFPPNVLRGRGSFKAKSKNNLSGSKIFRKNPFFRFYIGQNRDTLPFCVVVIDWGMRKMGPSFESVLMQRASKEVFKKGKALLKSGELLCCHETLPGVLRAVFRDSKGNVSRVEVKGFPDGPYSASCSCETNPNAFCCHAMAACLHHAKYTIKPQEEQVADGPAQYAGLKFAGLPELLQQVLNPPEATVSINAESDFPHMPSKWERTLFTVTLRWNNRDYAGNLNNLRQLHFGKNLAVSLQLNSFPQQDRQIIRYLAINAQQDGTKLSLDAEETAEFFHCLIDFQRFFRMKEKVVIHKDHAEPALLVEDAGSGCILRSAIIVKGVPLPLKDVKVVAGRAGCWVGMLGEYWWICAQADVAWIRNFLRTTVQPCDRKSAAILVKSEWLPVKIIETGNVRVSQRRFKPFFDGGLRVDGALEIEVLFDYDGHLCKGDQERLAQQDGVYWRRDSAGEAAVVRELMNFGFKMTRGGESGDPETKLLLRDREAIGVFVDELIPGWMGSRRKFAMSSSLAMLCGDASSLKIDCSVEESTDVSFDLKVTLRGAGVPVRWRDLVRAAEHNELFLSSGSALLIKIPPQLRRLAAGMADAVSPVPGKELKTGELSEVLRMIRPAAYHWARLADGIPGAVPVEFLRLKLDFDTAVQEKSAQDLMIPAGLFRGELRNYQMQGVRWLSAMGKRGCNLVLADEMGLGKTIQTLALLASDVTENLPALIICPTSLIDNWAREAARFTPELKCQVICGNDRKSLWDKAMAYDICITSYSLARRDAEFLREVSFQYLILDEAQHIKNPNTANAQTCKLIRSKHRLVLTGTPLENTPEDLWSIFDFLHHGFLGSLSSFRNRYVSNPSPEILKDLADRIAPFMLRRKKADVSRELPAKQEQVLYCRMGAVQRAFYEKFRLEGRALAERIRSTKGSHFEMLSALLRLRQICCDPSLLPPNLSEGVTESAKMELLKELLLESVDSGHKVLLFSQFTSLLRIIRSWMDSTGMKYEYLDGSTTDRMEHVDNFNNSPDIPVFLLSLKAGGVGLNLSSADTVIIYDPWWNPAAEAQAEDRSHRIGQTKAVTCIKLIVEDSIEEKVLELQKVKADLFENLVESPTEAMRSISMEDIEFLLN